MTKKYAYDLKLERVQNDILKEKLEMLQNNLTVQKELIASMCSSKQTDLIQIHQQEVVFLREIIQSQREKIVQLEFVSPYSILEQDIRVKLERNEDKIFELENQVKGLKASLKALKNNKCKEVYLIEPDRALVKLNDELLSFKQLGQTLEEQKCEIEERMHKYEKYVDILKEEYIKLRFEKKKEIITIGNDFNHFSNFYSNTPQKEKRKVVIQNSEDWVEILRIVRLSVEEIQEFAKEEDLEPLIDAIELLCKTIVDKNKQVKALEEQYKQINTQVDEERVKIEEENKDLKEEIKHLNKEIKKLKDKRVPIDLDNVSDISFIKQEKKRSNWRNEINSIASKLTREQSNTLAKNEAVRKIVNMEDKSCTYSEFKRDIC